MLKCVVIITLATFLALEVNSISFTYLLKNEWQAFKLQHSKTYANKSEEWDRIKIYLKNRQIIAAHNKLPNAKFKLEMNQFGDLQPEELKWRKKGYRMDLRANKTRKGKLLFRSPRNFTAPKQVDWRKEGYVTPVKNQKDCGSCWAFSSTGALEGQHKRKTGKLISLSEQNLVDCSWSEGNEGCNGGLMDLAFQYVIKNDGIDTEETYPYEAEDGSCRFSKDNVGADARRIVDIPEGNEHVLKRAVAIIGPISVAIDANHETFWFYKSGIYYEDECSSDELDHAVLVVGYGNENGRNYWLVKNSWGEEWGENGYVKMARLRKNHCGIATQASFPIV